MSSRRRHRSQTRGRSESRSRSRDRSRSRSPGEVHLPNDASPISESDYFLKSDEFRVWLRDEKRKVRASYWSLSFPFYTCSFPVLLYKYLDELTSDRSRKYVPRCSYYIYSTDASDLRRYFRKFVKAWNRGKLPSKCTAPL